MAVIKVMLILIHVVLSMIIRMGEDFNLNRR